MPVTGIGDWYFTFGEKFHFVFRANSLACHLSSVFRHPQLQYHNSPNTVTINNMIQGTRPVRETEAVSKDLPTYPPITVCNVVQFLYSRHVDSSPGSMYSPNVNINPKNPTPPQQRPFSIHWPFFDSQNLFSIHWAFVSTQWAFSRVNEPMFDLPSLYCFTEPLLFGFTDILSDSGNLFSIQWLNLF